MVRKSISITKNQEKWIKEKADNTGLSESDILRRIIDKEIENED